MSFQPVVPSAGYAGWTFLRRTREAQQGVFDKSPDIARDTDYFAVRIGSVRTAADLVGDRRLLRVALGAFGLDGDLGNKFFIQRVLSDGSADPGALGNRLADKRYLAMAVAFGLDGTPPASAAKGFADRIVSAFGQRQFEIAVGDSDPDLRLALGVGRDLGGIAGAANTADGRWFAVMGSAPVRKVVETALGLPASFARLDLDQQLTGFRAAAERVFGSSEVAGFADPAAQEKLVRLFLARSQAQAATTSSGQLALTLLQSSNVGRR